MSVYPNQLNARNVQIFHHEDLSTQLAGFFILSGIKELDRLGDARYPPGPYRSHSTGFCRRYPF